MRTADPDRKSPNGFGFTASLLKRKYRKRGETVREALSAPVSVTMETGNRHRGHRIADWNEHSYCFSCNERIYDRRIG